MKKNNLGRICIKTCLVALCMFVISNGYSAETTVKKINTEKKTVIINGTQSDGFENGSKVCFYNPDTLKRVACGKVKKTGKLTATVQVSEKALKRIKLEHTASTNTEKILSVSGEEQNGEEATVFNRVNNKFTVSLFYNYAPISSVGINAVEFIAVDSKGMGKLDSLWSEHSDSSLKSIIAAVGGAFAYNINELFSVSLGGSYSFVSMESLLSKYDTANPQDYVFTEQKPSVFSVFLDFTAYRKYFGVTGNNVNFLVGLLYENLSSDFFAAQGTGNSRAEGTETELAKVKTTMSVFGVRLGSGFTMAITQMFGLYVNLIAVIPVAGTPSYSVSAEEDFVNFHKVFLSNGDIESDLENAMGAKKKYGLDISVGTSINF